MTTLKILIADDRDLFRRGMRAVLDTQPGWQVTEAADGRQVVEIAKTLQPHVVIVDMYLSGLNGIEATRRLRKYLPTVEILLIGPDESEQAITAAFQAGARAYLTRSTTARDLIDAVGTLSRHKPFLNPTIAEFLLDEYLNVAKPRLKQRLTAREREVLHLLSEGKTNKEIAVLTGTSPKTVETHRSRLMHKLKARSLAELIRYAIRNRIIEP